MCGLYGFIAATASSSASYAADPSAEIEAGRSALSRLRHRGPDHVGWFAEPGLFLGHARLSILDPAPAAHQPFHEGDAVLLTNGEVYNFRELAQSLQGQYWRSTSDTEVVMRLLRLEGEAALPRFDGMFALAFWDIPTHRLLLARDRAGIKPLYYRFDGQRLEFASELKAFAAPLRKEALREVLTFGHFEAGCLPFAGVQELPPGYLLRYVPGQLPEVVPWFGAEGGAEVAGSQPPAAQPDAAQAGDELSAYPLARRVNVSRFRQAAAQTFEAMASALQTRLEHSVELHLRSDAPLGALCSGGLDSSLVAAMAQKHRPDLALYHCGSAEGGGEEGYARRVADHLRLPLKMATMDRATYWRLFPWVTWHLDMPVYHPNDISLYHVAKQAQDDGIKVLLAGEGADELFGGYSWHRYFAEQLKAQKRIAGRMVWRNRFEALLRRFTGQPFCTSAALAASAPYGLGYPGAAATEVVQGAGLAAQDLRAFGRWQTLRQTYRGMATDPDAEVLAFMLEDMHGHLGSILHRTDRVLMGLSIEGRVPFLENEVMDFALNLPLSHKMAPSMVSGFSSEGGKRILKRVAEKFLPRDIVHRKKVGFPVPWQGYLPATVPHLLRDGFVRDWTGWSRSTLDAAYAMGSGSAFRLIAIEVFGRIFDEGASPESLEIN